MTPVLAAVSLSAGYGPRKPVLHGVHLAFAPGRVVALLGENGSGKSTLLKALAGLLPPSAGAVLLHGRPLASVRRREAALAIGYLPQSFEPFFPATAEELVLLGRTPRLGPLGIAGPADRAAARAALEEVDAAALSATDLFEMSGGERQRVYLARLLAGETEVLLLDEPTANLDPRHRALVVEVLRRRAAGGAAVVFSTHELDVVAAAADGVALIRGGRLVAAGPLAETLTGERLAALFGLPARVAAEGGRLTVALDLGGRA